MAAAAAGQPPSAEHIHREQALKDYNQFVEGSYIWNKSEKSLGWERAKMAASIILGLGAIATILLMPYIQNHTFQDFGKNLLQGLEEAKWAILAGGITALAISGFFGLYIWRKNKEERNEGAEVTNLDEVPINHRPTINEQNEKVLKKGKELSVNVWTIAVISAAIVTIAAVAFSTHHYHVWNFDDLSRIHSEIIVAGAVSILISSIAYSIFKSRDLNQINKAKEQVNVLIQDNEVTGYEAMQVLGEEPI